MKELTKLEKLASNSSSSKGKSPCITDSLDSLIRSLHETRESIQNGSTNETTFSGLSQKVDSAKKDIDDRQKEIYNSLAKFGKTLDKVCFCCNIVHTICRCEQPTSHICARSALPHRCRHINRSSPHPKPSQPWNGLSHDISCGPVNLRQRKPSLASVATYLAVSSLQRFDKVFAASQESGVDVDPAMRSHFLELHQIVTALKAQDIAPALQ